MNKKVSYQDYIIALDEVAILSQNGQLNEGVLDSLGGLTGKIGKLISMVKTNVSTIIDETGLDTTDLIKAFKNREVFNVLKEFGFNLKKLASAYGKGKKALNGGLSKVFKDIHKNKIIQKINSGAITVDEFLKKYPILTRVGGVVVAGILLWVWLNTSFTGLSLDNDINQSALIDALSGNYSLADLFTSPKGLKTIAFLAFGLSGIYLSIGSSVSNIIMSIIYTGLQKSNFKDGTTLDKIKKKTRTLAEETNHKKLTFKEFLYMNSMETI